MPRRKPKLTRRQAAYVQYRAQDKPVPEAAHAAGYSGHATHDAFNSMEALPHIQDALARARTIHASKAAWNVDWWRTEAADALFEAKQAEDLDARLRWLDIAAKHLGIYTQSQGDTSAAAAVIALLAGVRELPKVIEARESRTDLPESRTS